MKETPTETLLSERIEEYLPPAEILSITPSAIDERRKAEYLKWRPGGIYALVLYENKLVMLPAWHPLNQIPISANSVAYGTGTMETSTLEPIIDINSQTSKPTVRSANIVLLRPRMERLYRRSFPAREIAFPINLSKFQQGIVDLMSVLGEDVLVNADGTTGIGSIRITIGLGLGKFSKLAAGQEIDASVESYACQKSYPDKAYSGEGLTVCAGPDQRMHPFYGKHSSHYGDGGHIGAVTRRLAADDSILFAPHLACDSTRFDNLSRYENGSQSLIQAMLQLALSDGYGAELLAIRRDGTILLPPMSVNRLGGVTADYIIHHLGPKLGIPTVIQPFCLQQVLDRDITGMFFAGNAARIAGIKTVLLHDSDEHVIAEIKLPSNTLIQMLIDRFEKEVSSAITPSHPSLLTPVDLKEGKRAKSKLKEVYSAWV